MHTWYYLLIPQTVHCSYGWVSSLIGKGTSVDNCVDYAKRRVSMKTSRSERDYLFGSTILSLRTAIGLKQAELANLLGISRLAVGKWEGGINYPKSEHLKKVIALGVKYQAFPAGREAEEIRALWKAAHQKMSLDEDWLSTLLSEPPSPQGQGHAWKNPVGVVPRADPMRGTDP